MSHPNLKIQIPNHHINNQQQQQQQQHHHHHHHQISQPDNIDDFKTSVLRRNSMRNLGEPISIPTPTNPLNTSSALLNPNPDGTTSSLSTSGSISNAIPIEKLTQLPTPIIKSKPSFTTHNNNLNNNSFYTHEQSLYHSNSH